MNNTTPQETITLPSLRSRHRKGVKVACLSCRSSHIACDSNRPCRQCVRRGKVCVDAPSKKSRSTDFIPHKVPDAKKNYSWHLESQNCPVQLNRNQSEQSKQITIVPYVFPENKNEPNSLQSSPKTKRKVVTKKKGNHTRSTSLSPDIGYTHSSDTGYTHSPDTRYTLSPDIGYTHSSDTGYTRSPDTGYTHSPDTGYTHSSNTGYTHSSDTGYTHSSDTGYNLSPNQDNKHIYYRNVNYKESIEHQMAEVDMIEVTRQEFENMKLAISTMQAQYQSTLMELQESHQRIRILEETLQSKTNQSFTPKPGNYFFNSTSYINTIYGDDWDGPSGMNYDV